VVDSSHRIGRSPGPSITPALMALPISASAVVRNGGTSSSGHEKSISMPPRDALASRAV
jgi:hypothetical protein